jgi:glycosyltransferase involved in cell wall biosynthesis
VRKNPFKDYRTLRDALGRLSQTSRSRELLLLAVGDDDAAPERVGDAAVRFVPFVADPGKMAAYYAAADVYVHAALADTFPTTVLEALACGTPVVATAVGGVPEQVNDGETGLLAPPGDAAALSAALARLLGDDAMRRRLGETAAEDARRRFDQDTQCDRYFDWYRQILSARGAPAAVARPASAAAPRGRSTTPA